jgi:hypothetical protein
MYRKCLAKKWPIYLCYQEELPTLLTFDSSITAHRSTAEYKWRFEYSSLSSASAETLSRGSPFRNRIGSSILIGEFSGFQSNRVLN